MPNDLAQFSVGYAMSVIKNGAELRNPGVRICPKKLLARKGQRK